MTSSDARPREPGVDETTCDVLVVAVGVHLAASRRIAIRATSVLEVASTDRVTEYPGAPADVPGMTAIRGRIIAVLDLVSGVSGTRPIVVISDESRALALAGGIALRVAPATLDVDQPGGSAIRLWSGRVLPVVGSARLSDAARLDAAGAPVLPLLDAEALIRDVLDDSDGER